MQLTLGIDAQVSALVIREIIVQALLGAALAVPFFPLIRRILRPALIDDALRARVRSGAGARRPGPFAIMGGQRSF
jgi:hypothetical protein